jgi:ubiquitin-like domain-containing CTD phosphatase 1
VDNRCVSYTEDSPKNPNHDDQCIVDGNNHDDGNNNTKCQSYTLIAKYGKKCITFDDLAGDMTIGEIKEMITEETNILPKRQKLVGLQANQGGAKGVTDDLPLSELKIKPVKGKKDDTSEVTTGSNTTNTNNVWEIIVHSFILMGTPEEAIFIDPKERDDLPDVVDDFDFDFNAGSKEWMNHVAVGENLKLFTEKTPIHIMNPPRDGKPLLVLDLDHTLLDFSSKSLLRRDTDQQEQQQQRPSSNDNHVAELMKRPYMDDFLSQCYQYYDLVVWSQTSWRWLETKLIELGMISNPNYKFCFVLDKTSMFTITSTRRRDVSRRSASSSSSSSNSSITHHVKPLQIIWSKFTDRWGCHNTVHIDDLSRNFALNINSGLKIKAYYRKKASSGRRDVELLGLTRYLIRLAQSNFHFGKVNFSKWSDVVTGSTQLIEELDIETSTTNDSNDDVSNNNNSNTGHNNSTNNRDDK